MNIRCNDTHPHSMESSQKLKSTKSNILRESVQTRTSKKDQKTRLFIGESIEIHQSMQSLYRKCIIFMMLNYTSLGWSSYLEKFVVFKLIQINEINRLKDFHQKKAIKNRCITDFRRLKVRKFLCLDMIPNHYTIKQPHFRKNIPGMLFISHVQDPQTNCLCHRLPQREIYSWISIVFIYGKSSIASLSKQYINRIYYLLLNAHAHTTKQKRII